MSDSGSLESEPLLAEVLGRQELLQRLGGVETAEDVALVLDVDPCALAFDLLLDPTLLGGVLDVAVLDADRAAVGVAQHVQQVAQLLARHPADGCVDAVLAAGEELAVEVPDGEAVGGRIELECISGGFAASGSRSAIR